MAAMYVKKPVVVEALQYTGDNWAEIIAFVGDERCCTVDLGGSSVLRQIYNDCETQWINLFKGSYVIKGIRREFYPCEAGVFAKTYELVEPSGE